MTIHSDHPFDVPAGDRDPIRRLRARLVSGVTVWTATTDDRPVGLTVSSMLVAAGTPARVLALVDPDSALYEAALATRRVAISVLGGQHRYLADAFAGVAPAPGGAFRLAEWHDSPHGPVLADSVASVGARLVDEEPRAVGWAQLVEGVVEEAEIRSEGQLLVHHRGRYQVL
jgi:flavin reductase (DIM6/NTAB) family NADH-FMN oxidoreductase RutF